MCDIKGLKQLYCRDPAHQLTHSSTLSFSFVLQRGWTQSSDGYYSFSSQQQKTEEVTIPSEELAQQVIEYARQLEMIV